MSDVHRTLDAVWKLEAARVVGALTKLVGDVGAAEELAQDAMVAALKQWPRDGVPDNPAAWLTTVAKRRAVDHIRRSTREREYRQVREDQPADDVLELVFLACHPVLPTPHRVALTLKLVCGLTTDEIARAFLVDTRTIANRVTEAKRALAERPPRARGDLASVLEVIYLVFNEGYSATSGDDLLRPGLCLEALRLGRMLAELTPDNPEVHGLVALMELQASRSAARTGPNGEPIRLHEQNRGRWDLLLIRRGFASLLRARGGPPGPYVLQAAIAACHAQARSAEDTDWRQIASLYAALEHLLPTPVVRLNRAVAVGMADGPEAGLAMVDALVDDLRDYHLLPSIRGDLLVRLGRGAEARVEFERAAALTENAAERAFLHRRADEVTTVHGRPLAEAATEFLDRFDRATAHSYTQTLNRLRKTFGDRTPVESLTPQGVSAMFTSTWDTASARTWNRHRAAVRSFAAWAEVDDLAAGIDRRAESVQARVAVDLTMLWQKQVPARERLLWTLLRESRAAVRAVLDLDVEQLDLTRRRADGIRWQGETARLLSQVLDGRTRGPLFLADRRPGPGRPPREGDLCPVTGRGRLSYERAEYLFKRATKDVDPEGVGYTLGVLRRR
ncbi:DUF6596 domain-containing protein [Actinokineospora inagensis]|uniref:DUF6596 domain-containing protein n=1 Tax=Actinokineospora inagensis TaxID=103730 RepID=UPI00040C90CC|nr:DUF6596 domain-containing protein [Actinokineospora inagensis]